MTPQSGILAPVPARARSVTYALRPQADATAVRGALEVLEPGEHLLVGLGDPLVRLLGLELAGSRPFPALSGPGVGVPSTQGALWLRFAGTDAGELVRAEQRLTAALDPVLAPVDAIDAFFHAGGRDLTGYVDGTENPTGDDATAAAVRPDGWSFVAVQRWDHDLARFEALPQVERDRVFGRTLDGDVELEDAPPWSHVRRTAQEDFAPEAFVVRRSMPFSEGLRRGLVFVAFGHSLDAYEALLRRMVGLDDGVVDALFRFSTPVTGGYYACPPLVAGRLELGPLGR